MDWYDPDVSFAYSMFLAICSIALIDVWLVVSGKHHKIEQVTTISTAVLLLIIMLRLIITSISYR